MNFDEFETTYKPVKNHLNPDASYDGCMFETYDPELHYVVKHGLANHHTVWTIVNIQPEEEYNKHGEPNPSTAILAGYHLVDRLGYLITEKPYDEHIEVEDN